MEFSSPGIKKFLILSKQIFHVFRLLPQNFSLKSFLYFFLKKNRLGKISYASPHFDMTTDQALKKKETSDTLG